MKINQCSVGRVVLAVAICILLPICSTVRCDIPISSAINIGPLALDAAAVAKLSNSPNQDAWWQLADEVWHDSAIDRFFSIGPLRAPDIYALAKQNGNKDAWKLSGINSDNTPADELIQKLQHAATTEYKMNKFITGTGDIEASMWTLMFYCKSSGCTDGYMTPIVVVQNPQNQSLYSYATVWLPATDKVLMNAIPASMSSIPVDTVSIDPDKLGLLPVFNIHNYLSQCPHAPGTSVQAYRTLIDSAYGLAPKLSCVRLSEDHDEPFKIVVVINSEGSQSSTYFDQPSSWPFNASRQAVSLAPLEDCSLAPLMIVDGSRSGPVVLCQYDRCINFSFKAKHYLYPQSKIIIQRSYSHGILGEDTDHTAATQSESKKSEVVSESKKSEVVSESKYTGLKALKSMLAVLYNSSISQCTPTLTCEGVINTTTCSAFNGPELNNLYPLHDFKMTTNYETRDFKLQFEGVSKWVSEQGSYTFDFQYAADPEKTHACHMLLDSPSLYTGNSSDVTPPKEIKIQAMAYLSSYIAEHNAAFTTDKGPATDPYTFYALIVSTALSVITIAVPFTDFMLHKACHVFPSYLDGTGKEVKIVVHVCCNVVLSFAFLLPVISLARNEVDRQNAFSTWALASNDLVYDHISSSSAPIRVFYLFSAASKYNSHFLTVILLVVCFTCVPVAASTARRCLQVFERYALICKSDSQKHAALFMKAMKAIEMGETEYLKYTKKDTEDTEAGHTERDAAKPQRNWWFYLRAIVRPTIRLSSLSPNKET